MKVAATGAVLSGAVTVPGSKSHTIRACLFAGLANGVSHIRNPLASDDCMSAVRFISNFGCSVELRDDEWIVHGIGTKWQQPSFVIDVGNSGTLVSFAAGIVATIPGYSVITGDSSICRRPLNDMLQALRQLGAEAFATRETVGAPPVIIKGPIHAGTAQLQGSISQYVSSLLLAAALTEGKTRIEVSAPKEIPFVKMTLDWLASAGFSVVYDAARFTWYELSGGNAFAPFDKVMPSDWSGVAFPLVAAVISHSEIIINNIDMSQVQGDKAIVAVLQSMGATIEIDEQHARLLVHRCGKLHGVSVSLSDFPDALPALCVAAAYADGDSQFSDIDICRLKETDRVALMHRELAKLGVSCDEGDDYLVVHGAKGVGIHGGTVESCGDHRIAMAFAAFGIALPQGEKIIINDAECCAVTFPQFYETMNQLGAGYILLESTTAPQVSGR
ncbi:MAG: 3-phosphoshikimate 1-carboxyvinyltransferase [Treponema sp.]|nr:3-phosphoshikimate 1-carboxyvinyltransferase [Treponema sp.]